MLISCRDVSSYRLCQSDGPETWLLLAYSENFRQFQISVTKAILLACHLIASTSSQVLVAIPLAHGIELELNFPNELSSNNTGLIK